MAYCYQVGNKVVCLPARMADGRILTDYRTSSLVNMGLQTQYRQPTQYNYRQYLMSKGNMVAAKERNRYEKTISVLQKNAKKSKLVPEQSMTICQGNTCRVVPINKNGVGVGRLPTSNWTPLTFRTKQV